MPRTARKESPTGIYHVMLRGIDRQAIFLDDRDRERFLQILRRYKSLCAFECHAWCLMENHVHLLLRPGQAPLSEIMKRVGCSYAPYFNGRHERLGHLFQDRYRSEAIDSDTYFLTVLRYILQNPLKAGLERQMGQYPWTSYSAYGGLTDGLTDTEAAAGFFHSQRELLAYLELPTRESAMDVDREKREIPDSVVRARMLEMSGCFASEAFDRLDVKRRQECIRALRREGVTIRQIARVSGLSRSAVGRIARKGGDEA